MRPFDRDGEFTGTVTSETLRRTAVRGAGAAVAGQAANFVLSMGSLVILARLLSPVDFGVVTMVTTVGLLFRSFGFSGFIEVIVQRDGLTDSLTSNLFWIEVSIGAFLTLAFAGSGRLLALFFHNEIVTRVAIGMAPMILLGCLGWVHLGLLQRAMYFKATALISVVGQVALAAVSISCAIAGWHYWALVAGIVAQSAATTAGAWLMCRWTPRRPARVPGTRSGLRFALSVYSHYAFNYLTRNTDNVLVGWKYGARMLGFYKKAYDLFILPESQLLAPVSVVVVSALSRMRENQAQFRRFFLGAVSVLALIGMGVGADFALVGKDIFRLLLGPGWDEAGRIFALFGPGIGAMLLYDTHGWIHLSIGRPERWFFWGLIEFACTATLFVVTLRWGPSGIACAWTLSFFLLMFPGFWYAGRPIQLGLGSIVSVIWRYFLASLLAGLTTNVIFRLIPHLTIAPWLPVALIRILSVSSVYFGLYLAMLIVLHRGLRPINETVTLIRDFLPDRGRQWEAAEILEVESAKATRGIEWNDAAGAEAVQVGIRVSAHHDREKL